MGTTPFGRAMREKHFSNFSTQNLNINHGAFGAHPIELRDMLRHFQDRAASNPDGFLRYDFPTLLDQAREMVADLVRVDVNEVILVLNASTGVNTVLRNLHFAPGDQIVYLSTAYGACEKTIDHVIEMNPGVVEAVRVEITYPLSDEVIVQRFEDALRRNPGRVRIAMFDTISSLPGIRIPFERLTALCRQYGVLSLIDGAHGVGCIPLDLRHLNADFFVSNLHKWLFVPRSCAILHVPRRNQHLIKSSFPTSHGYIPAERPGKVKIPPNPLPPSSKPDFVRLFEFVGTMDYAPYLCIPAALEFRREVCGGEERILAHNIQTVQAGAQRIAHILGTEVMGDTHQRECPMNMIRLPLRLDVDVPRQHQALVGPFVEKETFYTYHTFVPTIFHNGSWWVRVSGQVYVTLDDFDCVGRNLEQICSKIKGGNEPWAEVITVIE